MFDAYLNAHSLREVLADMPVCLFPCMDDRAAWDKVAEEDRAELLNVAAQYVSIPYPACTATQFLSFVRTGSRSDYEQPYFARRRKLMAAVLHGCLTGTTEQLDEVVDGLWCICEETSWVISAHNVNPIPGARPAVERPLPDEENPYIDLFSAQTGMILSLTCQLLARQLDCVTPMLRRRVRREVEKRILTPFLTRDDFWWMGFVRKDLCNWTPWIVSNVLVCAVSWMQDRTQLAELMARALRMVDRWLNVVPEDGGCDEGAGYWNMAGGALLDILTLLERVTDGQATFYHEEKVRRILSFPAKMQLDNGWFVNFADCDARPFLSGERMQRAGEVLRDVTLERMGSVLRGTPWQQVEDVPHMTRLLMRLHHPAACGVAEPPAQRDVYLPDLQVRVVQQQGMVLCCKGGHNGESHNHNDVGSFMLYVDGQPALVDAGNMTYTAKTFSDARYTLWNTRSAYHNVPLVGVHEQQAGREYAARHVQPLPFGLRLDMAAAYGADAGVERAERSLSLEDGRLTLADTIALRAPQPVTWVFLLKEKPVVTANEAVFGHLRMGIPQGMETRVEEIPITDARMQRSYPGSLWRLCVTAPAKKEHSMVWNVERLVSP